MPWPLWLPWIMNNSLNISPDLAIWKDIKKETKCLASAGNRNCETSILAPSARNMNERCNLLQLNAFSAEGKTHIYHGPKIRATNLEAELLILILWPHFGVQNLAPVLGPQNTNRSYSIRAASVLLPPQADSSTYPWYYIYIYGTCCSKWFLSLVHLAFPKPAVVEHIWQARGNPWTSLPIQFFQKSLAICYLQCFTV